MTDLLWAAYPWIKALHIMSVLAWMAGLFYLPRLFVYHVERAGVGNDTDSLFQTMESKLFRIIMQPAMMASWGFGLLLVATPGVVDWSAFWPYAKAAGVVGMTAFHIWCGRKTKVFASGENTLLGSRYRMMNEVPTLLMVVIVIAVIVRPV